MTPKTSATLGELTNSTRPICYGVLKPGPFVENGVPLVRIVDIAGDQLDLSNAHRISSALDTEFARSRLEGGELLLSIQGTIGRVAIAPLSAKGANISRTIAVIAPDDRVDRRYLRYFLMYLGVAHRFKVTGTTRDSLNIGDIRSIEVPLATPDEQRRIVGSLDSQLSRVASIETSLQSLSGASSISAMEGKIARLRRSLLHAAFTGQLTREFRNE